MKVDPLPVGLCAPPIGFGCWGMSDAYGPANEKESVATIEEALAMGIRHFDTADVYDNGHNDRALVNALESIALAKNGTAAQIVLAWLMSQGPDILPIPGMKRRRHLQDNIGALKIELSSDDLVCLSTLSEAVQG